MSDGPVSFVQQLCAGCGMCCDGVMFHSVLLQEAEVPSAWKSLGIRLKEKKGQPFIPQPCQAHDGTACTIYENRPQRCRLFQCRQLKQVEAGELSVKQAQETIARTRHLADVVLDLLAQAGSTNEQRSLRTRYEHILSQPEEAVTEPADREIRTALIEKMERLEAMLSADFRV
jgi:uncharacterized protein